MFRSASCQTMGLALVAACLHTATGLAGGTLLCGTAGDELVAARAGLVREWVVQLPFDSAGSRLESVTVDDGLVVARTSDGTLHAVSTGTAAGLPRPGSVLWSRRGAAASAPGGLILDPELAARMSPTARVDVSLPPPQRFADGIAWSDAGGTIFVVASDSGSWRGMDFENSSPLAGQLAVRDGAVYAATKRGDLYRLENPPGGPFALQETWRTALPFPPTAGPLVLGNTVVVSLGGDGIMAFSALDGTALWSSCVDGTVIAGTGTRLWCLDRMGRLTGIDVDTGMPSEWLCLGAFTLPVVNGITDRLVLASPDGLLVSLASRLTVPAVPDLPPAAENQPPPPDPAWHPDAGGPMPEGGEPPPEDAAEPAAADARSPALRFS